MAVFMFQKRFAEKVRDGSKRHTIRAWRKRIPKKGERASLREWSGVAYRSPQVAIWESVLTRVAVVSLFDNRRLVIARSLLGPVRREQLAIDDGFESWSEMFAWFEANHSLPFVGHLYGWEA